MWHIMQRLRIKMTDTYIFDNGGEPTLKEVVQLVP